MIRNEKINLSKCKSVLQRDGSVYSDNEVLEIREFLYKLAEIEYAVFLKLKAKEEDQKNDESLKQAA